METSLRKTPPDRTIVMEISLLCFDSLGFDLIVEIFFDLGFPIVNVATNDSGATIEITLPFNKFPKCDAADGLNKNFYAPDGSKPWTSTRSEIDETDS